MAAEEKGVGFDPSNCCWRLENNFTQARTVGKAVMANETDRFWDLNETELSAIRESSVQQMRYPRWRLEMYIPERRAPVETPGAENSDFPTNTESFGTDKTANQFATVSSK
jgi:hypothetical protein